MTKELLDTKPASRVSEFVHDIDVERIVAAMLATKAKPVDNEGFEKIVDALADFKERSGLTIEEVNEVIERIKERLNYPSYDRP